MLVDLYEVSPLTRKRTGPPVGVNPAHVVLVRPYVSANDADAQAFATEVTLAVGGKLTVDGAATEIKKLLNAAGGAR
jgi:hypothetical protein